MSNSDSTIAWWRPEIADDSANVDSGPANRLRPAGFGGQAGGQEPGLHLSVDVSDDRCGRLAFAALVAFTGVLVLSPQAWFPVLKSLRIAFLAGGVAIAAHVLEAGIRRRPVSPPCPEIAIALMLVGWSVITVPLSYWPGGSVNLLTDHYLKAIAFFWLIATLVSTASRLRIFGWVLVLCSVPLAVTALNHYYSGKFLYTRDGTKRIAGYLGSSGLAGNPNDLALMLNLLLPLAGALLICERRLSHRLIAGAALLLSIAAVIVTFSRAGFLTLVAIALMSLAACARRRRPGAAVALLVVALAIPPLLPKGYLDRLETITDMSADRTGSAQGRWSDFGAAIEIAASNPILGVGIGQDILALNELRGAAWRSVHNVYLQYAIDLGLPGLLLFLALFWGSVKSARRVQQRAAADPKLRDLSIFADAITVSLIGFAVAAFFHPAAYQFYFFCLAGLAVALKNACPPEARLKPGTTTQSGSG